MIKKNKKDSATRLTALNSIGLGADRDYFIENVSMLVASGMGILETLSAVQGQIRSARMRRLIDSVGADIESGAPLWRAFETSGLLPAHAISLIRIGEESGKLSDNLRVVSLEQEKERGFRSKVLSAVLYPVFILVLTCLIGLGIAWFILPKLSIVFSQLHLQLPFVTRLLVQVGFFFGEHGAVAVPLVILCVAVIVYFVFYFPGTKRLGQALLFAIPGIKGLIQEIELARFGYLLGTLLEAGLPITTALYSLSEAAAFENYRRFYAYLAESIEDGNSFQRSFMAYPKLDRLIPVPMQHLVVSGEQSGNLVATLKKMNDVYEAKTETTTKNLTVILEPLLLVIVWLGVVSVALAVILPIYNLIGGLRSA